MVCRRVDTAFVFKQRVKCFHCDEDFYFTLHVIAEGRELKCPACCNRIDLQNDAYSSIVRRVKDTLRTLRQDRLGSDEPRTVTVVAASAF